MTPKPRHEVCHYEVGIRAQPFSKYSVNHDQGRYQIEKFALTASGPSATLRFLPDALVWCSLRMRPCVMNAPTPGPIDARLLQRVRSEFTEMPGLRLTVAQASRLWNTDVATSVALLDALVESRFLRMTKDHYGRTDCGRLSA